MNHRFLRPQRATGAASGARLALLAALVAAGVFVAPAASSAAAAAIVAPPSASAPAHRVHRRHVSRRHSVTRVSSLHAVRAANSASRSTPTPGAYINAALYYDFEAGRLYTVNTSPRFLTAITLRPGEKLISKAAGDTVRWVLGETVEGAGPDQQVIVFVKPVRGGLRTNIILTTDQRTYILEAVSREGDVYTSVIAWNYPQEQMREQQAALAQAAQSVVATTAIDHLNFSYSVKPVNSRKGPRWQPLRVFDDGLKTYIQFPANLASSEAPPLFLVGPKDQAQLVNYRLAGDYYVVDRLIDVAELRLGEKPQVVVRITRTGGAGPAGQGG
jgi:type IV secretion system protein VirB9